MKGLVFYLAYAFIGLVMVAMLSGNRTEPATPAYRVSPAIYQSLNEV